MSIHTLIPLAAAGTLAGLLYAADVRGGGLPASAPVRGVMWLAARWRWQHGARQAYRVGAELVRGVALLAAADSPTPGSQEHCPRCGGRRCRPHRDGLDCGPQRAPGLSTPMRSGGRHDRTYRQPVPPSWSPLPLVLRARLWPAATSARLGRQVQLGATGARLP